MSHGLWQRRYGSDSSIIGREIVLNDRPRTVVGVLPPGVEFPAPDIALWAPMRLNYDTLWTRNNHYLQLIGRLAPDASVERAQLQIAELARRFTRTFRIPTSPGKPLHDPGRCRSRTCMVADARPYIVTLFVAVTFVLLIACVNVANLMLARGESRRSEVAIRTAMGASRFRVVRQALTESLLFALVGGAAGLAIAARHRAGDARRRCPPRCRAPATSRSTSVCWCSPSASRCSPACCAESCRRSASRATMPVTR